MAGMLGSDNNQAGTKPRCGIGTSKSAFDFTCGHANLRPGDLVVELLDWPEDWRGLTVVDYALLLLDAEPPRRRAKGDGPQRRGEDRESLQRK